MIGSILLMGATGVKLIGIFNRVMEEELLPGRRMRKTQRENKARFEQKHIETLDWGLAFTPEDMDKLNELLTNSELSDLLARGLTLRHKINVGKAAVGKAAVDEAVVGEA